MRRIHAVAIAVMSLALVTAKDSAYAQSVDATLVHVANRYFGMLSNITYRTASNWDGKLDVYRPAGLTGPNRTIVFFHGGGWTQGDKEGQAFLFFPLLQDGWSVVNVEYRTTAVAHAPAAVEDGRCALRWVYRNAKQYNFDTSKLVVMGNSAGGHLALMTGIVPASAGMDYSCPGDRGPTTGPVSTEEMKVAAIVDLWGITDVGELLSGPNTRSWAVSWLGSVANREEVAKRVSPLTYVRQGLPPVIIVHGDQDPVVPYAHSQKLAKALTDAGVPHQLVTVPAKTHGGFVDAEFVKVYDAIRGFLAKYTAAAAN